MKKLVVLFGVLALALALGSACKKEGGEPAKTEPAKTEPAKAEPAKAEPAAEAPKAAEPAKAEPAAEAPKAAEPAAGGDSPAAVVPPAAAPAVDLPIPDEKLDKMVTYIDKMTTILEENAKDPAAAAAKLDEYLKGNKADLEALKKEMDAVKEKLTPEQQQALGMKLLSKMGPTMQRMMKLFQENPNLATDPKINEVMSQFK